MRNLRAASVQFEHKPGDKSANLQTVQHFVKKASQSKVEIIAFPECCLTGYWHLRNLSHDELSRIAEPAGAGFCTNELLSLSKQFNMTIGAGFIEIDEQNRLFNSYLIAMPDGRWQCHRKLHAFIHPSIQCGDRFTVFDAPQGCRIGVLICYDNNLVENARINALMGAEILLAPHQTGGCKSRSPHAMGAIDPLLWDDRENNPHAIEEEIRGPKGRGWLMRWLPSRAHDNGLFILFSNGVGIDDDEVRTGNAMILDPYGRILSETGKAGDDMVIAHLDASLQSSSTGRRWLQARRPELYSLLAQPTGCERQTREVRMGIEK